MIPVTHLSHWPRIRLSVISLRTAWKQTCRNVLQPSENHVKAHLDSNSPNETYCLDESELGMWNTFEMENNFGCTLLEGYTPPHFSNDLKRNSNELFKWEIQTGTLWNRHWVLRCSFKLYIPGFSWRAYSRYSSEVTSLLSIFRSRVKSLTAQIKFGKNLTNSVSSPSSDDLTFI